MTDVSAFPTIGIETDLTGDGSGQKFPHVYSYQGEAGLTKRELYAAMALQGLLAKPFTANMQNVCDAAGDAVAAADALIDALRHSGSNK